MLNQEHITQNHRIIQVINVSSFQKVMCIFLCKRSLLLYLQNWGQTYVNFLLLDLRDRLLGSTPRCVADFLCHLGYITLISLGPFVKQEPH